MGNSAAGFFKRKFGGEKIGFKLAQTTLGSVWLMTQDTKGIDTIHTTQSHIHTTQGLPVSRVTGERISFGRN